MSELKQARGMQMTDLKAVKIIYPERRFVPVNVIHTWFLDAKANEEIGEEYLEAETLYERCVALQDAGLITLG